MSRQGSSAEPDDSGCERKSGLHFVGLCSFAFAQPIFDLLGRHGEFFVSRNASSAEIAGLTLGLIALPPLLRSAALPDVASVTLAIAIADR
jgi:hypothetical protein